MVPLRNQLIVDEHGSGAQLRVAVHILTFDLAKGERNSRFLSRGIVKCGPKRTDALVDDIHFLLQDYRVGNIGEDSLEERELEAVSANFHHGAAIGNDLRFVSLPDIELDAPRDEGATGAGEAVAEYDWQGE